MIKTDCFAYNNGQCSALKRLYCIHEKCSFYKSTTEKEPTMKSKHGNIDNLLLAAGVLSRPDRKKPGCEYYVGSKDRYCKATGNDNCRKCKFFSPKMPEKAQMLADMLATEMNVSKTLSDRLAITETKLDRIFNDY